MPRRHLFAGLAAVLALAVPLSVGVAAAGPATQKQGARTVAVSETANLPATDAGITVTGSGFDIAVDSYVAVCRADTAASDPLTYCLGGPIPDENDTAGWAVVTTDPEGKRNSATLAADGSFSVDLTLASASDSAVDCLTEGCVLIVRSAGEESGRPQDITVGLGFAAASSSGSTTSGPASSGSSTTSEAPSTVGADSVALPDAYLGQQQTVVFSGFTAGEQVGVTVFSEPVNIDGVVATAGGVVAITFPIAEALVPGVHTVQAIGQQSGLIGLATFTVVAAPVTSASSESVSSASSSVESSSSAASTAPPTAESAPVVTTAASTTSEPVTSTTPTSSGTNLWWLWVTLALLVVAVAVAVAVVASRRRAQLLEQERLDREAELAAAEQAAAADAAAATGTWQSGTGAPYTSPADGPGYQPYDPGRSYDGLLSGRQGDGPALYSGQGLGGPAGRDETPTQWIDPDDRAADLPTTAIPTGKLPTGKDAAGPVTPAPPASGEPPVTQRLDPNAGPDGAPPVTQRFDPNAAPADPDPAAPRTEQWSPFGDEDEPGDEPPRRH